jgi:hypothetical protein
MAKNRKQQAAIALSMKKRGVKPKKKKVRKARKYQSAGFQQVEYGPNVLQTGALNQNQQAYLNAQMSNYQTGQDIINMDADMTLDMIQQQQEASKQKGVNAANKLLRGDREKDNFLNRLRDKFRRDKQDITTNQGTTTYAPNQLVSPTALASTSTVTAQAFPEIAEKTPTVEVGLPTATLEDLPEGFELIDGRIQYTGRNMFNVDPQGVTQSYTPDPSGAVSEAVVEGLPPLKSAPPSSAPVTPGPVPAGGGTEIALDASKSPLNQALDFSNEAASSATTATTEAVTKTKAPLLGTGGRISQALTKSALGTTKAGGQTAFAKFGSKASAYALPAVIIGEGTKMLSDDKDPTTMNVGESVGTALSSAGQGAGIGSAIGGPVGAAVGAIIGTGVGLYKGIKNRNIARDKEAEREEELIDLQKQYRKDRKSYLATASPGMQRGTYYMGEMGGMNPNMSFKQKLRAQMAMGGIKPMNNQGDMIVYGPTHEQGGVMRDATTELEGGGMKDGVALPGEVITNVRDDKGNAREYYFSDHLKNPNTGNTFAEDYIRSGGMNYNAKQTFAKLQELVAGRTDKDRSPQTIAKNGGMGERLDDISGQLAKASKMHAGQSKKIGSMAKQLMKKANGGYKMYQEGDFKVDYPISGAAPGTIFPEYKAENLPFYQEPLLGLGNFKTVDVEGSGMQAVFDTRTGELVRYDFKPVGGAGSLEAITGKGPSSFLKLIPNLTKSVINPKALSQGQKLLPSGQKVLTSGAPQLPAPKLGLPAPKSNVPMVINKLPATTRNVPARNIPGVGGGATGPTAGGPVYDLLQFNKVNTLLPQIVDVGSDQLSSDPIASNQYIIDNLRPEIPTKSTDPADTPESTESTEVNTNNLDNAGRPRIQFDQGTLDRQKEINKFFNTPDPDLPGQTYGDQYGVENLDEDGLMGPKTKAALKTFEFAKEREADFDEVRAFNQSIFDDEAARRSEEQDVPGDEEAAGEDKKPPVTTEESGLLDRLLGNKANLRTGLTALSYGANLLTAKKNLDELEKLKVTPEKITPERLGKIKITNEAERKLVQESTNAALNQATSPDERIALLSKQQEAIGKSEEGRRNKQLIADLEVDKINNKNAFTAEIYNVANDFKAQIENMQIDAAVKKGRIAVMDKLSNAIATMAMDANKMETAYKNMKEYGEAMAGGIGNLSDKYMKVLMNLGLSEKEAKEIQNQVNTTEA